MPIDKYEWDNSVYGNIKEEIPEDIPKALGKTVDTISYVDANLLHDLISGKAVAGTLHFLNQTPIDSYSKKQNAVETSTYGSEDRSSKDCYLNKSLICILHLGTWAHLLDNL